MDLSLLKIIDDLTEFFVKIGIDFPFLMERVSPLIAKIAAIFI